MGRFDTGYVDYSGAVSLGLNAYNKGQARRDEKEAQKEARRQKVADLLEGRTHQEKMAAQAQQASIDHTAAKLGTFKTINDQGVSGPLTEKSNQLKGISNAVSINAENNARIKEDLALSKKEDGYLKDKQNFLKNISDKDDINNANYKVFQEKYGLRANQDTEEMGEWINNKEKYFEKKGGDTNVSVDLSSKEKVKSAEKYIGDFTSEESRKNISANLAALESASELINQDDPKQEIYSGPLTEAYLAVKQVMEKISGGADPRTLNTNMLQKLLRSQAIKDLKLFGGSDSDRELREVISNNPAISDPKEVIKIFIDRRVDRARMDKQLQEFAVKISLGSPEEIRDFRILADDIRETPQHTYIYNSNGKSKQLSYGDFSAMQKRKGLESGAPPVDPNDEAAIIKMESQILQGWKKKLKANKDKNIFGQQSGRKSTRQLR